MKNLFFIFPFILLASCNWIDSNKIVISSDFVLCHKTELLITGPNTSEYDQINPFLDYRLVATFSNGDETYVVPGFYAADGNAAETSSSKGNIWKIRFRPDRIGEWKYKISFRKGKNIALCQNMNEGNPVYPDGFEGSFKVKKSNQPESDYASKGRLIYDGSRYLKYAGTDKYFLKLGTNGPENFLAYEGFDGTYHYGGIEQREGEAVSDLGLHQYKAHEEDWMEGDPVWKDGKGKGIIGAINYLSDKGMNVAYMLTMNVMGDGKDVWPWTDRNERYRFDCSKLDQWEIVFDYMESKGVMIHLVTQETENECLLDGGATDVQRMLYYRELVARFGHHLAITWNLGEENGPANFSPVGQTDQMRKDMANYLRTVNPYPSFIVIHSHADFSLQEKVIQPLLGFENLDGLSMQIGNPESIHQRVIKYLHESEEAGRQWVVCVDEPGPHYRGIMPDSFDENHDTVRHHALWGALMAGAGGFESYFGFMYPHTDLNCEDFRSRDKWWDQCRYAKEFFENYLPFVEMKTADELVNNRSWCLAKTNELFVVYIPSSVNETSIILNKKEFTYEVFWYNPRTGGSLQKGSVKSFNGKKIAGLGLPPDEINKDWIALVKKQ